jgi:hypothetical protein
VFTKAIEWAHEKEWRLYAGDGWEPSKPFEDVSFNQQELDAVLLGCAMPSDDRKRIAELTRSHFPAAKIFQARKHDREFSLIMEEVLQ